MNLEIIAISILALVLSCYTDLKKREIHPLSEILLAFCFLGALLWINNFETTIGVLLLVLLTGGACLALWTIDIWGLGDARILTALVAANAPLKLAAGNFYWVPLLFIFSAAAAVLSSKAFPKNNIPFVYPLLIAYIVLGAFP